MGFFINPPAVSSEVLQNISCESETMPRSGQQQATKCEEKAAASFVVFIHATVLSFLPLMVHFGKKKDSFSLHRRRAQLQKFRGRGMSRVESESELAGRIMNPFHLDDGAVEREKMSLPPRRRLISGS